MSETCGEVAMAIEGRENVGEGLPRVLSVFVPTYAEGDLGN